MNTVTKLTQIFTVKLILGSTLNSCTSGETRQEKVLMRERPDCTQANVNYAGNRSPLRPMNFIKLPVGAIQPEGWLKKYLNLQKEGLTGHLGEISAWLAKDNNAWLTNGGDHGWEEVPYWLKGYGNMAYILKDEKMINEAKTWIEGVFRSQQPNGYFGPVNTRNGKPELWAQMIMLWCLQSYYEYSQDERVINLMTNYFKWQMTIPDEQFLEDTSFHSAQLAQCEHRTMFSRACKLLYAYRRFDSTASILQCTQPYPTDFRASTGRYVRSRRKCPHGIH